MPKTARELSAIEIKRLTEPGYHAVGGVPGLMLRITDSSSKNWTLRTTINGKRSDLGLGGGYPEIGLAQARERAAELRERIRKGYDPTAERKAQQQADQQTFKAVANAYIAARRPGSRNAKHADQWVNTLATYAYPTLGDKSVSEIGVPDVLGVLAPIWSVKTETANRVRGRIELVLSYAEALEYRPRGLNPATWRNNIDKLLPAQSTVAKVEHRPAVDYRHAQDFLKLLRNQQGFGPRCLELVLFTAVRSGEARGAVWSEFDMANKVWQIPAERMKIKSRPHRVPLSDGVLELLQNLPRLDGEELVFPGMKAGRPLSDMTLVNCMRRMKILEVPHGLRSTFRDWAAETTAHPNEVVEMALAHAVGSTTEAAYRRGDLFDKRRELMDAWAAYLTAARADNVIPLHAAA